MHNDKAMDESKAVAEIIDRLHELFPNSAREVVVEAVEQARSTFGDAKVRDFVPVLIEKEAKSRLKGRR